MAIYTLFVSVYLIASCHLSFLSAKKKRKKFPSFLIVFGAGGGADFDHTHILLKTEFFIQSNWANFLRVKYAPFAIACKQIHTQRKCRAPKSA